MNEPRHSCPHHHLHFETGGKILACRDCGQCYTAQAPGLNTVDHAYFNANIIRGDRRSSPLAPTEPKPQ